MGVRSLSWKTLPLWAGVVGAVASLAFVLISELRIRGNAHSVAPSTVEGDLVFTGFQLSTLRDSEQEWKVTASRARVFERTHQALLDGVRGTVRMDDGSLIEFEGASAVFDTESRDLQIDGPGGGAVVKLPSGYVLRADRLTWIQATGQLVSDDAVSLSGPRLVLNGVGVRINPATQELTILHQVRANVL